MTEDPSPDTERPLSPQDALVAVMVAVSFSDEQVCTAELVTITAIVNHLPAFASYDQDRISQVSRTVLDLFAEEDGLDALFGLVRGALPVRLHETAYALACDVAAADGRLLGKRTAAPGGDPLRARHRPPARRRHRARSPRAPHHPLRAPDPAA